MSFGRLLLSAGLLLVLAGIVVIALERFNVPIGRMPGDLIYRGRNTTVYFPWVTCLLLSVLGTLVLWFINRGR